MTPQRRALVATILFSIVGFWSVLFHNVPWEFSIPHILFYAVLTINTSFSVRFFSAFTPESMFQSLVDGALAVSYVALALSIGLPVAFSVCALIIFTIAPMKYAHMLGHTPHDKTLRKKILIDLMGTMMCVVVLVLTLCGMELDAAWLLAVMFAMANVYLLAIRPMYAFVK